MFRNLFTILLALCFVFSFNSIEAGRKRAPKSGKIKKGVFVDSKYNFQISIPEGWKGKAQKENASCRLKISYKEGEKGDLRTNYLGGVDGFELTIPFVSVWVIETNTPSKEYLDSFLKTPTATVVNEKIVASMEASWANMNFASFKTWSFNEVSIDSRIGANWLGLMKSKYKSNNLVFHYKMFTIFDCVRLDENHIIFIAGRTEPEHFNEISSQLKYIMRSVIFEKP